MSREGINVPILGSLERIPGGLMLIPLIMGSVVGTFAPGFLEMGSFTTALFADSALPLIALLIFATGTQVSPRQSGAVLAHTGTVLLTKTVIPGLIVIGLGYFVGLGGIAGLSLIALLAAIDNQNGGLWLALSGQYGDENDRGAYVAAAISDGPFTTLVLLGLSGLAAIPAAAIFGAILPFLLGFGLGNLDPRISKLMKPVPTIVIPFFAFALGTGIDLIDVAQGGLGGVVLGILVTPVTGAFVYLGYRFILRKGIRSGIGFAAGTTAGNAVATPAIVAAADPTFEQYVSIATAQVAGAVLVTAILAPIFTTLALRSHIKEQQAAADDDTVTTGHGDAPPGPSPSSDAPTGDRDG